jgi:hypothetical protein
MAAGDDPPGRRFIAPNADDLVEVDVAEAESPDDVRETGLDVGGDFVADRRSLFFRARARLPEPPGSVKRPAADLTFVKIGLYLYYTYR